MHFYRNNVKQREIFFYCNFFTQQRSLFVCRVRCLFCNLLCYIEQFVNASLIKTRELNNYFDNFRLSDNEFNLLLLQFHVPFEKCSRSVKNDLLDKKLLKKWLWKIRVELETRQRKSGNNPIKNMYWKRVL